MVMEPCPSGDVWMNQPELSGEDHRGRTSEGEAAWMLVRDSLAGRIGALPSEVATDTLLHPLDTYGVLGAMVDAGEVERIGGIYRLKAVA